jgi:hypothetical protein
VAPAACCVVAAGGAPHGLGGVGVAGCPHPPAHPPHTAAGQPSRMCEGVASPRAHNHQSLQAKQVEPLWAPLPLHRPAMAALLWGTCPGHPLPLPPPLRNTPWLMQSSCGGRGLPGREPGLAWDAG